MVQAKYACLKAVVHPEKWFEPSSLGHTQAQEGRFFCPVLFVCVAALASKRAVLSYRPSVTCRSAMPAKSASTFAKRSQKVFGYAASLLVSNTTCPFFYSCETTASVRDLLDSSQRAL